MKEEEKKTTKKTSTKKSTTPKKEESEVKKKTTRKKSTTKTEDVKVEKEEKKATPKKTATKKTTGKKATAKKKTTEVKALPPVVDDIDLEKAEEIEVESVPEKTVETEEVDVPEETIETEVVEKTNTDALPVIVPEKEEKIIDEVTDDTIAAEPLPMELLGESVFDGKLIQLIGWYIIGFILSVVTLGLGAPFAKCFILDWRFKHTKINGKRLAFDGNGLQLWGNYIKWTFFTIITLGIFLLFLPVQWNKWIVKHTHYEGNRKPKVNYSLFDGITWEYIGISVLSGFLNLFSFGLLAPFCETLLYSWRINHTTYDTIDMEFDGKGFQLLGNYIKWTFLTIITLGIYGLWVPIRKIQWEVKHTHEKGYARKPYRPILGMFLPVLLAIACLGGIIFGLTKVQKDKWIEIKKDVTHYVDSIKKEIDKYDWDHVAVERLADIYYRINTRDINISWDERYERYFDFNKVDKLSDNYYHGDKGIFEVAFIDLETSKAPVLLTKNDKQIRVYWIYEKKIESHYFNYKDDNGDIKIVTDKKGSHLAYVPELKRANEEYCIHYLEEIVDYYSDCKRSIKMNDTNLKLEDADIHYTKVDLDGMKGYKDAVDYYKKHTNVTIEDKNDSKVFNEDEVNDMFDDSTYSTAYISYLKNKLTGNATVAVVDLASQEYPALVVMEENKSYILSYYDGELHESSPLGKASIGTIKKTSKSSEDYVLIATDANYRYYYFVESYAEHKKDSYDGPETIKVKKNAIAKNLEKYSYKETTTKVDTITVSKNSLSKLEEKLIVKEEIKVVEEDDDKNIDSMKAGDFRLAYGDYVSDVKDVKGGSYTLMRNGNYSYVNPYATKDGKKITVRETGSYEIKLDYVENAKGKKSEEKVPTICMTSNTKGSNYSNACWVVDKDNHFMSLQTTNNWTFKK